MANVFVNDDHLKDAAKAIREVNGQTSTYYPSGFGGAIRGVLSIAEISEQDALLTDIEGLLGLGVDTGDGSLSNPFTAKTGIDYDVSYVESEDDLEKWIWYKFTPASSGTYNFYGSSNGDIDISIWDYVPVSADEEGNTYTTTEGGGFDEDVALESGTTYYIAAKQYNSEATDAWRITLVEDSSSDEGGSDSGDDSGGSDGTATLTVSFAYESTEPYDWETGEEFDHGELESTSWDGDYTVDGEEGISFSASAITIPCSVGSVIEVIPSEWREYGSGIANEQGVEVEIFYEEDEYGEQITCFRIAVTAATASVTLYDHWA